MQRKGNLHGVVHWSDSGLLQEGHHSLILPGGAHQQSFQHTDVELERVFAEGTMPDKEALPEYGSVCHV